MNKSIGIFQAVTLSIAIALVSCNSDKRSDIIVLNQNIHHDDFEYSVTAFTKTSEIIAEKDTLRTNDIFYLVHFKVVNEALRVGHKWDNTIAYLVDEKGTRYENIEEIQDALDRSLHFGLKHIYNTPHGSSDSTILVFNLPAGVKKPYLKVRGESLMGDVFDAAHFRKVKVALF
jgi:hypothetical protein